MKTETSPIRGLHFQEIALLISAKRTEQGEKHQPEEGKMDWAKVVLTIVGVASKIAIDAMDSSNQQK